MKERRSFGLFEGQDDWSGVAYFYLNKPNDDLPQIDSAEQRMKGLA